MEAVKTNSVYNCLNILAHATPDDINILHSHSSHTLQLWAPLHVACAQGRTVITQLLIWVSRRSINLPENFCKGYNLWFQIIVILNLDQWIWLKFYMLKY